MTDRRTRTHLFIGKPDTEENRKGFVSTIPLGRPSTPADVANACCYLASEEAAFITGVNLEVRCIMREGLGMMMLTSNRSTEDGVCRETMGEYLPATSITY